MKKFKTILTILLLVLSVSLSLNLAVKAEEEEEWIELTHTWYGTTTKVKIPKNYNTKEAEMRGAWVATVWNIDFKKQNGTDAAAIEGFKQQFQQVLDTLEAYHMNTLFFQVRPCNDAFYESEINPWSHFLMGTQGKDPGWDPMEYMVEETHKRGMEFNCWMNAFRLTEGSVLPSGTIARNYSKEELLDYKKAKIQTFADNNYGKLHPEAVIMGSEDCKLILNPGDLGVQEHIVNTLKEIVEKYDVDGLHFDDYFYLTGGGHSETANLNFAGGEEYDKNLTGANTLNDVPTYYDYLENPEKYDMEAGLNLGTFRRESINNLMKKIRTMIDAHNTKNGTHVEYGSKPAAVWLSNSELCNDAANSSPEGSNTACGAYSSYWALYADTKKWVEEGWVDWVAPQVYYDFENREAPYADIVSWWADVVDKTNEKRAAQGLKPIKLYIAHGIYQYDDVEGRFNNASEMQRQLKFNQMYDAIQGSAVYKFSTLLNPKGNVTKAGMKLLKNTWSEDVFSLPRGENNIGDAKVGEITITKNSSGTTKITFDKVENAKGYAVYKVEKGKSVSFDVENRVEILYSLYDENKASFELSEYDENYDYYLRVVSDTNHLSTAATKIDGKVIENGAPTSVDVNLNDGKDALLYTAVKVSLPYATDPDGDELTYKVQISVSGVDGTYYDADTITKKDNVIEAVWESFVTGENVVARVIISDGDKETVCYSNVIKILEKLAAKEYTVVFKDEEGNILKEEKVKEGSSATAPSDPVKEGYNFVGWDKEFNNITGDLEVTAKFEKIEEHVPPVEENGCKKDLALVVISLISLTSTLLLIRKRK